MNALKSVHINSIIDNYNDANLKYAEHKLKYALHILYLEIVRTITMGQSTQWTIQIIKVGLFG